LLARQNGFRSDDAKTRIRFGRRLLSKSVLDRPVLERVIGNDGRPTRRLESIDGLCEQDLESFHFLVHRDSECLESASRRIDPTPSTGAHGGNDGATQIGGRGERSPGHDTPGDGSRSPLLPIPKNQVGQLALAQPIH